MFFEIAIPLICLTGLITSVFYFRNLYNPWTILSAIWLVIGAVIPLGLWNVWPPNIMALRVVFVGVIGFQVAGILHIIIHKHFQKRHFKIADRRLLTIRPYFDKSIYVLLLLAIISAVVVSLELIPLLLQGATPAEMRVASFSYLKNETAFDKLRAHGSSLIATPLHYAVVSIAIVDWLFGRQRKVLAIGALFLSFFDTVISGGRYKLVMFILIGTIMFGVALVRREIKLRQATAFILAIVCLVGIVFAMTFARPIVHVDTIKTNKTESTQKNSEEQASRESFAVSTELTQPSTVSEAPEILESSEPQKLQEMSALEIMWNRLTSTLSIYYTGSVTFMGELLGRHTDIAYKTKGINFIHAIADPFVIGLRALDIIDTYPQVMNALAEYTAPQVQIGEGVFYNAMPTIFFSFYMDFGLIGVFSGSLFFTLLCLAVYRLARRTKLIYFVIMYSLLLIQVLHTSTSVFIYNTSYVLSFLYASIPFVRLAKIPSCLAMESA